MAFRFSNLLANSVVWSLVAPITWPGRRLMRLREEALQRAQRAREWAKFKSIVENSTVLHGPFAGMKYPVLESPGSSIYPKLLGTYELELHPALDEMMRGTYDRVVVIGCGEGYYAVGLAMRLRGVPVTAVDTNPQALRLCKQMAELNGVGEQVELHGGITSNELAAMATGKRLLVVSDCEGYEMGLFSVVAVSALSTSQVLIEMHDFVDPSVVDVMVKRFSGRNIELIKSIDDNDKVRSYELPELAPFSAADRRVLLSEGRPGLMTWIWGR